MSDSNDEFASCASFATMDERQTALLSVSVTFNKAQENLEIEDNSNSEKSRQLPGRDNSNPFPEEKASACKSERNTSTPPTLDIEEKVKVEVTTKSDQVRNTKILPGWKGYGNNIYIQPIIVNPPTSHKNKHCCSKSRKFTAVEDMRKQLRLRQASEWIIKHNQRIQLKGSLETTGVPTINAGASNECICRCQSNRTTANPENTVAFQGKLAQHRQTSKLAKGFVCRHWARDFLSKENETQEVEEDADPPSLTIRSYVNVNMLQLPIWNSKKTKTLKDKKIVCANMESSQPEKAIENAQDNDGEKGHQVSRRSSLTSSSISSNMGHGPNDALPKGNPQEEIKDLVFRNISVNVRNCRDDSCTCRSYENTEAFRANEMGKHNFGKEREKGRNMFKPRQEQIVFTPVLLKEFPPINPLRGSRISSKILTVGKRKLTPRRPHTVNTAVSSNKICEKKKADITRISSSRSLDSHFRGIYGKAVKQF